MKQLEILNKDSLVLLNSFNLLGNLVNQILLEEKISDILLNQEDKKKIKELICGKYKINSDSQFNDFLEKIKLNESDLYEKFGKQFKIDKYCLEKHSHQVGARFLERKNELDQVIYSLIRVKDVFTAQELFLRIKDGANFGDIAKEFSEGPENKTRGIIGPISLNTSTPLLTQKLITSEPNKVNAPFQVSEWWLITRLEALTEASLDSDTELIIAREIMQDSLQEEAEDIIKSLNLSTNNNNPNN